MAQFWLDNGKERNWSKIILIIIGCAVATLVLLWVGASFVTAINVQPNKVNDLAHNITANCTTDDCKARAVYDWINENIKYKITNNYFEIIDKELNTREGDCYDQSILYCSMMKSLGLSCRVYFNVDFLKFAGHAFVFVEIAGRWIPVDLAGGSFGGINENITPSGIFIYLYSSV